MTFIVPGEITHIPVSRNARLHTVKVRKFQSVKFSGKSKCDLKLYSKKHTSFKQFQFGREVSGYGYSPSLEMQQQCRFTSLRHAAGRDCLSVSAIIGKSSIS